MPAIFAFLYMTPLLPLMPFAYLHPKITSGFYKPGQLQLMKNKILTGLALFITLYISISFNSGCAQIGSPTGGIKDTLAPVLVRAAPAVKAINFSGNRITLTFDEYVTLQELQNNLLVSPLPKITPTVTSNLKTVSIRLRDTLLPNTTYSIQFGDAIRDINEANIIPDFTYVFSTGRTIDSLGLQGKVLLAETGLVDSTLSVLLYRNIIDTAVQKFKPDYMAKVKGDGSFMFNNLAAGDFKLYALKDGDGSKNYSSKAEIFAFLDSVVIVSAVSPQPTLYAFAEEPPKENKTIRILKVAFEKRLRYSSNLSGTQDLQKKFELNFNNPLKIIDTSALVLTDTNYNRISSGGPMVDSTKKIISYNPKWIAGSAYRLIVSPAMLEDSAGNKLVKADTINFSVKTIMEYGRVVLRFKNYDQSKNPVLQFIGNGKLQYAFPLTNAEFSNTLILPGEYELRILFDMNKDGVWTAGNYLKKLQPEKAITLPQKLPIKADWDNERDITL